MLSISPIPAFNDNYIWLIETEHGAWVVDPGDPAPVLDALAHKQLSLSGVLITHHHFDHTGGIAALRERFPELIVYGPDNPLIEGITHPVRDGERVVVDDHTFEVIAVPGHTLDHVAYVGEDVLFCGDTLFAGGCGRMFEGSPPVMQASLAKLAQLPENTKVYCAHEYTLANLAFAKAVEPNNAALDARIEQARALREQGVPTVPSDIALERATNPFLRWDVTEVKHAAKAHTARDGSPAAVFGALRQWKDEF